MCPTTLQIGQGHIGPPCELWQLSQNHLSRMDTVVEAILYHSFPEVQDYILFPLGTNVGACTDPILPWLFLDKGVP